MTDSLINSNYFQNKVCYDDLSQSKDWDRLFKIQIWRVKDVAKFLGCSIGHIYNLASEEKIPKRKKGKYLFFVPEEILNWIIEGD